MNHPLASSVSIDKNDASSYWETALELLLALGTILHSLVIPLLVAIGVQFAVQFVARVRHDAGRRLQRHAESLERDRLRLIEEIKIDLLKTLNKGGKVSSGKAEVITLSKPPTTNGHQPVDERVSKELPNGTSSPTRTPGKTISGRLTVNSSRGEATNKTPNNRDGDWIPRKLDRKECSNIVNEIIYQIQSGARNSGEDGSRQQGGGGGTLSGTTKGVDSRPGNAEDSAILRDVHKRNVVARMKTLFEQQQNHPVDLQSAVKRPPADLPLRHFSSVVNILRRNDSHGSSRSFSTSLENIRAQSSSGGGGGVQQFLKATSEPPTVIRLRRRIRSHQSLSESVEDILESERFSKRLSQYSISDLLDEDDQRTSTKSPHDRVQKGLKTLSTFSLSELLQDDEPETETVDGEEDEVVLRRSAQQHSSQQRQPPAHYRNAVDNIEQILVAENLSKDYWKYSISNLLDFMEEDDGGVVCLQEYS